MDTEVKELVNAISDLLSIMEYKSPGELAFGTAELRTIKALEAYRAAELEGRADGH